MTVDKEVLELCDDADLVIHDAQYTDEEFLRLSDWGHSTPAYAVLVAREAGARRLSLFHHDPSHTDREIDRMLEPCSTARVEARDLEVTAAAEGTSIDLGRPDRGHRSRAVQGGHGRFATGVTVVAGIEDGQPVGFTCQSFVSLSVDPPFVAVAPARTSTSWPRIARAGSFCVNVLGDHQEELCRGFAVSGGDKFDGVAWHPAPVTGSPVIEGSLAWVDCEVELVHDAGDHELIIGQGARSRHGRGLAAPVLPQRVRYCGPRSARRGQGVGRARSSRNPRSSPTSWWWSPTPTETTAGGSSRPTGGAGSRSAGR